LLAIFLSLILLSSVGCGVTLGTKSI